MMKPTICPSTFSFTETGPAHVGRVKHPAFVIASSPVRIELFEPETDENFAMIGVFKLARGSP